MNQHRFDQPHHVIAIHKRHFQVKLRKLWLAIRAQVFVTEAAGNLKVAFEARHHEQLLQLLRRLRQRVELAWMNAAGHHVIACAFRGGFDQNRRFNFHELALMQEIADRAHDAIVKHDVALQRGAAQVKIAILEPHHFIYRALFVDVEGRGLGRIQDDHLIGRHLDVAGRHARITQIGRPRRDNPFDLQHELDACLTGSGMRSRRPVRIDGNLHQAAAVA